MTSCLQIYMQCVVKKGVIKYSTHNRTALGLTHVIWAIQRKNRCNRSTWAQDREKKDSIKKSQVLNYLIWSKPRWTDSTQSRVPTFKLKSWWVTILQGRGSFRFSYWFSHGPYNSAALMRSLMMMIIIIIISSIGQITSIIFPVFHSKKSYHYSEKNPLRPLQ